MINSPSSSTNSSPSTIQQTIAPVSQLLDRTNYIYWKSQVLPSARTHQMDGFLFGAAEIPPESTEDSQNLNSTAVTSDRSMWIRLDQFVMSWLLASISEGVRVDSNKDEQQEFGVKSDHDEDQNSIKQHLISSYKKNLHPLLKAELHQIQQVPVRQIGRSPLTNCDDQWTSSWWMQFKVLLQRGLKERKHESYSGLRILQVISVSIISGLLWWHSNTTHIQDQVGLLFFFATFWGFFPLFNAVFTFPQERPMLIRERSSGMYRLSSYYFARIAGDLPMELVLPTIFTIITYWMGGLKPSLAIFLLTLLIILFNVLVSQGVGLALGAIIMDLKQASTLSTVLMLVFLLVGGYYIEQFPPFIAWLKYISFNHYCYKLLVGVQYSENEVYECGLGGHCRVRDFPGIKFLGVCNMWWDVAALGVMLVGYRVLAYVALRMGRPH